MKTLINKYLKISIILSFVISINLLALNGTVFSQSYLSDDIEVPFFRYQSLPMYKYTYWDLSEINTENNRLDLTIGITEQDEFDIQNFTHANWYKNSNNVNFNSEVVGLRMIYAENITNPINGLIFVKLNTNSTKKDLVITRGNGDLEVYWNDNGTLTFERGFKANGNVAAIGNFTSGDNLEDVAVIRDDTVKIYKNLGNGYLDSIPVYRLANVQASAVALAQISSYTEPYRTLFNTTSDKDEIIIRQGDSVMIYLNNNSNGTSLTTTIYTGTNPTPHKDFKIADFNNDGYNDIVIVEQNYGINLYKNYNGTIGTTPIYSNTGNGTFDVTSVSEADFNKDGWRDIVIGGSEFCKIFLNNKSDSLFAKNPDEVKYFNSQYSGLSTKISVADLYNKGGLAILTTVIGDVQENAPNNYVDRILRINASDSDAVPAPAYLFKKYVQDTGTLYHPKLQLFNRGDRDFLRYRIYKNSSYTSFRYTLIDSTSGDSYIDLQENLIYSNTEPADPPPDNLFYYVVAVDESFKVSISSDSIGYNAIVCLTCPGGYGDPTEDNIAINSNVINNELPKEYSLSNYPNPFNPTTNLEFGIAKLGFVSLKIYDLTGKEVAIIVNENLNPGTYKYKFDGSNFSSGIYFYRLESNGIILTRRMLLIK